MLGLIDTYTVEFNTNDNNNSQGVGNNGGSDRSRLSFQVPRYSGYYRENLNSKINGNKTKNNNSSVSINNTGPFTTGLTIPSNISIDTNFQSTGQFIGQTWLNNFLNFGSLAMSATALPTLIK